MTMFLIKLKEKIFEDKNNRREIARISRLANFLAEEADEFTIHKAMTDPLELGTDLAPFFALCTGIELLVEFNVIKNYFDSLLLFAGTEFEDAHLAASVLPSKLSGGSISDKIILKLIRRNKWSSWAAGYAKFENQFDKKQELQPFSLNQLSPNYQKELFRDCLQLVMVARKVLEIISEDDNFVLNQENVEYSEV